MADEVQIDSLSIAIEQSANDSSDSLARLSKNLRELKSVTSGLRLTNTVNGLNGIGDAVSKLNRDKVAALGELGGALAKISGAGKISSSFAKQIAGIGAAIDGLGDIDTAKLTGLADALSPLAALDRAKLTSYINQLKQLPEVADALDGMDMDRFAASIRRAADAMKPLADEMEKVSNGFSALPTKIQRIIRENERMTASTKKGASGWKSFWKEVWGGSHRRRGNIVGELLGITSATTLFFKARDVLVGANTNINDYIENLNLYGVAMGKYAREQFAYAKTVEAVLGINPSQWTRMQAVIQDMAKSFGVAEGTATLMSKSLTQLAFDYASFYNLSTDEAANKVRSAIAGEIEPVRALGKDLSVAKLQLTATELGINGTVEAMTQADKAMLRTITLLRQSESAQGDLARTLDDPANQMRIFAAQTEMLSTALGELFLPILQEVLPYAIATVKVLRMVTEEFARLAGFELPDFESTSATEEVESLGGALEDAADAAKELYQLSFDELNILGAQMGGGLAGTDTDKLTSELERLAAIQDAAFMKDVEDSVAGITEDMVDWLTKGQGIEVWVGNIWEKFEGISEFAGNIAEMLGLWDGEFNSTDEILDTIVSDLGKILAVIGVIKGLGLVNSIYKAITGDGLLASALGKIFNSTKNVSDAFGEKNKKLKEQTKDTAADTAAVGELTAGLVKANTNVLTTALSLGVMGASAAALSKLLSENPLTPVVDTTAVSTSYAEILEKTAEFGTDFTTSLSDTTAKAGETVAMGAAQNYATLLTWLANTEVSSAGSAARVEFQWNKAWEGINEDAVNYSTSILSTVDSLGNSLYDGMTSPIIKAADVFAGTLEDMWDDYAAFNAAIGNPVGGSFRAKGASGAGSYTSTASSSFTGTIYGNSWKGSQQKDQQMQVAVDAAVKAAADAAAAGFFETNRNNAVAGGIADAITGVIDKTLGILGKVLGFGSMSFGIPAFASGGIVEDGLFMANSTELVGRFANGRTAVANNQQITDGIANGVREANHELIGVIYATAQQIVQAVNEGSVLYLDGERVTKKVTNAQNRANRMHGTTMQNV